MSNSDVGIAAERIAEDFLKKKDYRIIGRNYRKPWGEIDLIAEKDNVVIFVEVKANMAKYEVFAPELRAGFTKITKVIRTARTFLADKKYGLNQEWQIDVISITLDKDTKEARIKHFKNIET